MPTASAGRRPNCAQVQKFADKVIFNSISQLARFYDEVRGQNIGLRVNPG